MRYSIDSDNEYIYDDPYARNYMVINVEFQRILIRQPMKAGKLAKLSIFYFTEVLCESPHLSELGEFQSYLFMGSNMNCQQMYSEERQTSSLTPWFPFCEMYQQSYEYPPCESPYCSSFHLDKLFEIKKPHKKSMTWDFCPWSKNDGLGVQNLFVKTISSSPMSRARRVVKE